MKTGLSVAAVFGCVACLAAAGVMGLADTIVDISQGQWLAAAGDALGVVAAGAKLGVQAASLAASRWNALVELAESSGQPAKVVAAARRMAARYTARVEQWQRVQRVSGGLHR